MFIVFTAKLTCFNILSFVIAYIYYADVLL